MSNDKFKFIALNEELQSLYKTLQADAFAEHAYIAEVEDVNLKDEKAMAEAKVSLNVDEDFGRSAILKSLRAWRNDKVANDSSTKYVKRYAGFVISNSESMLSIVDKINDVKDAIKHCVQDAHEIPQSIVKDGQVIQTTKIVHGRNAQEKHDFIHQVAPRTMTLQLYRHIPVYTKPVVSISYYWTVKSVPKRLDKQGAIDYLKRKYDNALNVDALKVKIADIEQCPFEDFEIPKVQKAALIASIWDGKRTRNMQCTTPVIITNPVNDTIKHNHVKPFIPQERSVTSKRAWQLICKESNLKAVERIQTIKSTEEHRKG